MSLFFRRAYNHLRRHRNILIVGYCNFFVYTISKLLSISIGKNCVFYGIPFFEISKESKIQIGDSCQFRSMETSNNIGLNHKCILACSSYSNHQGIIKIGNSCGFSGVSIWCASQINIGNNVRVGANTLIMDHDAHFDDPRTSPPEPIIIEDNVFIGANCVIKKGVNIGENSMIGMNSVVTKDIPANCVAVGIPAKIIRELKVEKSNDCTIRLSDV